MMTWHGGLSGSAPLKVAEVGHLNDITRSSAYPEAISVAETIFSPMNIIVFVILLVAIPMLIHNIAKRSNAARVELTKTKLKPPLNTNASGAERIDQLWWLSKGLGMGMAALAIYIAVTYRGSSFGFLNPNYINFCLLAACLWLHTNFSSFLQAVDEAIKGASGILIQFPIYFGILALMQSGGLISLLSDSFIAFSNTTSLPILALISSGIVNVFVPSGGGQWAIQGPVLLEAASQIGVPLPKIIMAMAYGDELTNMLQPFWALPLLSITGLNAKQILPYTILIMMLGFIVFCLGLLLF
jgi:short-chain fatty acids transporter